MKQLPLEFPDGDTLPRLLPIKEICRLTSFSKAQIHRMVAASSFPKPLKISARRRVWCPLEVRNWLAARRDSLTATTARAKDGKWVGK
jgi:predicted DNA-binding transcriptional regulator AlpA